MEDRERIKRKREREDKISKQTFNLMHRRRSNTYVSFQYPGALPPALVFIVKGRGSEQNLDYTCEV